MAFNRDQALAILVAYDRGLRGEFNYGEPDVFAEPLALDRFGILCPGFDRARGKVILHEFAAATFRENAAKTPPLSQTFEADLPAYERALGQLATCCT